ncbi:sarcosine oxidase subunit delta [Frigidibacter sp. MR17.14]|uniref:sarcosine oxidase subunit delta n=1 Tax=Frigidibacter sp. MR17.14 TaxID=3126509 RepID=UPI003012B504
MKRLTCPVNGIRDIAEFQYLGPFRSTSPEDAAALTEHLFYAPNPIGPMIEWWRHRPTNTVFLAERHTATDHVLRTWLPGTAEPQEGKTQNG